MCLALPTSGLWLRYATLQNLIPHALHPGPIQGKEGIKFCHLATLGSVRLSNGAHGEHIETQTDGAGLRMKAISGDAAIRESSSNIVYAAFSFSNDDSYLAFPLRCGFPSVYFLRERGVVVGLPFFQQPNLTSSKPAHHTFSPFSNPCK